MEQRFQTTMNQSSLPPYNPNGACPKCGAIEVRTSYQVASDHRSYYDERWAYSNDVLTEFLLRRCQRCGYEWGEACLPTVQSGDAKPPPDLGRMVVRTPNLDRPWSPPMEKAAEGDF